MIRLVLVDAHPEFLESLSLIFRERPEIQILASSQSGEEAVEYLEQHARATDIVVLSLQLDYGKFKGILFAKYLLKHYPHLKLLVYSVHEVGKHIQEMYAKGVSAFLFKDSTREEFLTAIDKISQGQLYYAARTKGVLSRYVKAQQLVR